MTLRQLVRFTAAAADRAEAMAKALSVGRGVF